ncbi:MAG: undecaprenyldiphospho-muramoylpentapeptide beta-N-acetylglucosaminyltransferase [Chthonomonadales bacterium]
MRVVVTGGGTGGHIYPAIAVAEELRRAGDDVLYVGATNGLEARVATDAGFPFVGVAARKIRKLVSPSTVSVLLALARGYRQASAHLMKFRPDVVIGTGGYVAAATGLAAAKRSIPLIIQACDAIPGRTNRLLARRAWRICIWFEETANFLPAGKTVVTGVPLREGAVSTETQAAARQGLGLNPHAFTLTVLGGSQGARRLNQIVLDAVGLLAGDVQVLHQTGEANLKDVQNQAKAAGLDPSRYQPRAYLIGCEMARAYRAADLVICRCGIATLAELTVNGVAGLLVPLPTAYADHQTHNALAVVRRGAGILLREPELTGAQLAAQVRELQRDTERLHQMAEAGRRAARPHAAATVAEIARSAANRGSASTASQ